ncbi:MAG: PadR family transcriptional regulator [Candidatus Sulfotelmatobacter sp.]
MNQHVFEVNEIPTSRFGGHEAFERMFRGRSEHSCGEREHAESDCSFGRRDFEGRRFEGREDFRSERGCGGREHRHGERGFRGRGHGGFEGGFGRGGMRGFERFGGGRGRGRMFDAGDIKLVILKLLSEQPSYGYQLIKTMEERLSGGYTPSAGVIYPTLTMLEEEGLAVASVENNKKVYSVTGEGKQYLEANQRRVDELFERLEETSKGFERGRSPELMKAFMELREAVVARVFRQNVTPEQIQKITEAIKAAAKAIDEL